MAYIRDIVTALGDTAMPIPDHELGDYIVAYYSRSNAIFQTTMPPSGWQKMHTAADLSTNNRQGVVYRTTSPVSGSKLTTIPVWDDSPTTGNSVKICFSIAEADATTFLACAAELHDHVAWTTTGPHISAITTTEDNALCISVVHTYTAGYAGHVYTGPMCEALEEDSDIGGAVLWWEGGAAGTQSTFDADGYRASGVEAEIVTFAVKDAGSGIRKPSADHDNPPSDLLFHMGYRGFNGKAGNAGAISDVDLTATGTNLIPTLGSIPTDFGIGWSDPPTNNYSKFDNWEEHGAVVKSSFSNTITLASSIFATNQDVTGKLLSFIHRAGSFVGSDRVGKVFGFSNTVDSWARFWQIDGKDLVPNGNNQNLVHTLIDPDDVSFVFEDVGTPDLTDCEYVTAGAWIATSAVAGTEYGPVHRLNVLTLRAGTSTFPCNMATAIPAVRLWSLFTVRRHAGALYEVRQSLKIGDGTKVTLWNGEGQSVAYPGKRNLPDNANNLIPEQSLEFDFDGTASCDLSPKGMSFDMGDFHYWGPRSGRVAGTWNCVATVVRNSTPRVNSIVAAAVSDISFFNSKEAEYTGTIQNYSGGNVIFDGCVDPQFITLDGATQVAIQTKLDAFASATFRNMGAHAIRIYYTGTGNISLTFSGQQFSGNVTADILYEADNASQLTAVMSAGANASSTALAGSATGVVIQNSKTLTITNAIVGGELRIYDDDSADPQELGTELGGIETLTGTTFAFAHDGTVNTIIVQLIADGYEEVLEEFTLQNADQTLPLSPDTERNL